jgi:hypothetical protein
MTMSTGERSVVGDWGGRDNGSAWSVEAEDIGLSRSAIGVSSSVESTGVRGEATCVKRRNMPDLTVE